LPSPPVRYPVYPTGAVTRIQESLVCACIRCFPVMRLCGGGLPCTRAAAGAAAPFHPRAESAGRRNLKIYGAKSNEGSGVITRPRGAVRGQRIGFQLASDLP